MDPFKPNPEEWPFEAHVEHSNGREYSQFAKDNGDETVSFISWEENGPVTKTIPKSQVKLKERPWEKAKRWQDLYAEVYGEKKVEAKFSEDSLQNFLRNERELVAKGELPASQLEELADLEESFRGKTQEDWADYNFFFSHFPVDTADHTLLIARGHLLIARKISDSGRLGQFPPYLLPALGKLNALRERVVRGASTSELAEQIEDFLSEFDRASLPVDRGEALGQTIQYLYSEVRNLTPSPPQLPQDTET